MTMAKAAATIQTISPNLYDLQGRGLSISYSTSSIAGPPQMSVKKGRQTLNFSGSQIRVLNTEIGDLVTVTLAIVPDASSTALSVLIPAISLSKPAAKQVFRTIATTTVHKLSLIGPVTGVQETYKITDLRGTARQVAT
jgi:hypothetical protein